jgi:sulfite exporter TauE/SafE/copper chaperone CopZ
VTEKILKTETFLIGGMSCAACKNRIEKRLLSMPGISEAEVSYSHGTARVVFDEDLADLERIFAAVEALDYKPSVSRKDGAEQTSGRRDGSDDILGVICLIFALYIFVSHGGGQVFSRLANFFPQAERGMGYGMLFTVGLLTSLHCLAMCGGINLSQSMSRSGEPEKPGGKKLSSLLGFESLRTTILYNAGRVASYTVVGGIVGAAGSVISFSGSARGMVQIIAGVFMVIIGINMLGVFTFLRRFTPRLPGFLVRRIDSSKRGKGPLYVGLLNGFMPCGPLQAMQLYALYTGSPIRGALSMLVFSLGTVPLMFGLGAFGSLMSRKFAGRVMKIGAALVIVMGVIMADNGVSLSGFGDEAAAYSSAVQENAASPSSASSSLPVQDVTTSLTKYGRYQPITVKAGAPVKLTIHADPGTINGCNNAIVIPAFNLQAKLKVGDTVLEFTPQKPGVYRYSCWMGMIRSTITVVEDDEAAPAAASNRQSDLGTKGAAEAAELEPEIGADDESSFGAMSCHSDSQTERLQGQCAGFCR